MTRNFGLDVMRSVSIWLVLLQHLGYYIPNMSTLKIGGVGVEIFFVLSGYLIGGILFKEIDKGKTLINTLKSFWIRRWFRILPLYYAVLLFKFAAIDNSIGTNILYYVFFLQNNFYGVQYLDVSWSLVIEEWFYLFAPIFLFLVVRKLKTIENIIKAICVFILSIVILRSAYVISQNPPYAGINGNFPVRFDSLFCGVLLSLIHDKLPDVFKKLSSTSVFLLGLLLFTSYLMVFRIYSSRQLIDSILFFRIFGFLFLPMFIALMVPYISSIRFNFEKNRLYLLTYHFLTITSILTYAMYLIHPFINDFLQRKGFVSGSIINTSLSLILTYSISWLVYTFFEKPILALRNRFSD